MVRLIMVTVSLCLVFPLMSLEAGHGPRVVVQQRIPAPQSFELELDSTHVGVPMEFSGSRPSVEVMINGKGPNWFLLDTGATGGIIDGDLAKELALPHAGEAMVGSPLGQKPLRLPLVGSEEVKIGPVRLKDVVWTTMDQQPFFSGPDEARGIISAHWFTGVLTTIDFANHAISFRPGELSSPDGQEVFEYSIDAPLPTLPVAVASVVVDCVLDTGSPGGLTLPSAYIDSLPLKNTPVEIARARTPDAEFAILAAPLEGEIQICKHRFVNPEVRFSQAHPHGELGQGILDRFVVTLDTAHHRVQLSESQPEE